MKPLNRTLGLIGICLTAVLVVPPVAPAAQLIGQTGPGGNCGDNLPYVQTANTLGNNYSPAAYGVITLWFQQGGVQNSQVQLLVLRPNPAAGPTHFITTAKDQVRTSVANMSNLFFNNVRLPIEAGERLGLFIPPGQPGNVGTCSFSAPGANNINWPAAPGEPPLNTSIDYSMTFSNVRLNAGAFVETDADRDVFGDESQDHCIGTAGTANGCPSTVTLGRATPGKNSVTVEATVPGAGELSAGSAEDQTLAAAAKKKKKKGPSLKKATRTLTSRGKQTVKLTLGLTKSGKAKLAKKGNLGLSIKVTYTPAGGTAGVATASAKLKKKKKR